MPGGGFEPPQANRSLAPQASASTYSAIPANFFIFKNPLKILNFSIYCFLLYYKKRKSKLIFPKNYITLYKILSNLSFSILPGILPLFANGLPSTSLISKVISMGLASLM